MANWGAQGAKANRTCLQPRLGLYHDMVTFETITQEMVKEKIRGVTVTSKLLAKPLQWKNILMGISIDFPNLIQHPNVATVLNDY